MNARLAAALLAFLAPLYPQPASEKADFLKEVQPVLSSKCLGCHSGEGAQGGFKAHTREELLKGGKSGPAVVPGKGSESLLVLKMEGKKGLRMPPSGPPLDPETIARIRLWIDQGAPFNAAVAAEAEAMPIAPRNPPAPPGSAAHPVDRFVDAYFIANKISAPAPVSDAVFARRAFLDITGLPPAPEDLAAFVQSNEADKRSRLVDNLLKNSRAYAEHWISFWNDLLRNDEGVIYHGERKSITDWLLRSLESNAPLNTMVRSLLDPPANSGAEGFLTGVTWRGVVSASQTPPMQAAQNAAQVFLGINLKCAACHDSFINRWKLKDTYGLASMFSAEPLELVRCDVRLGKMAEPKFPFPDLKVRFGDTLDSRRSAVAEWFVHPENGRFARTVVNRYWKRLFGRGLVEPVDDMDAEAWNQDLLDSLAFDFAAKGFDLRHLLRQIMTSRAYQLQPDTAPDDKKYFFRGPRLRRVTAEQFEDTLSAVTGEWRVSSRRSDIYSAYTREWKLKSDSLSRALGRPIRDQVYTERSSDPTTLQALELSNGPLLSRRLERGAKALLGELPPTPANLFDSKVLRSGSARVDVDLSGANELWLLVEDVDSYDPARVVAGWGNAELVGPGGAVKLKDLRPESAVEWRDLKLAASTVPGAISRFSSPAVWKIAGKGFTRFRAEAAIDERSRPSDIGPAVRFFVFIEKPDPEHLIRVQGDRPVPAPPARKWSARELADRLYLHLLGRSPNARERATGEQILGGSRVSAPGAEDLLWALLMSPEFQYIH